MKMMTTQERGQAHILCAYFEVYYFHIQYQSLAKSLEANIPGKGPARSRHIFTDSSASQRYSA